MKSKMKRRLAMVAVMFAGFAQAALVTLEDQATITASETTLYKATSSVTVKLTGDAADGVYTFKSGFYLAQGVTVTFDTSEVTGNPTTICMQGSLRGAGKLYFGSGITALKFGGGGNGGSSAVNRDNILHLPVFEGDVEFHEGSNAKVIFQIGVSVVNWPTASYEFADGVVLGLFGEDLFTDDNITLSNFDIDLMTTNSTLDGITITVPEGRRIYHRAGRLKAITDASESLSLWSGESDYTHNRLNINLDGGSIQFQDRARGNILPANIYGTGTIDGFTGGGSCCIKGQVNYSGTLIQRDKLAGWLSLDLTDGSSLENVDCSFSSSDACGYIKFTCASPVTMKSVSTANAGWFWISEGSELTVNAISGNVTFDGLEDAGGEVILPNISTSHISATELVTLTLSGTQTIDRAIEAVKVAIAEGADIHCDFGSALASIDNRGGTLTETVAWQDKVALWTDASASSTFVYAKDHLAKDYPDKVSKVTATQIFEWKDVRPDHQTYALRVSKYDTAKQSFSEKLFPYLDSNPAMVSFPANDKARMAIAPAEYGKTLDYLAARCVIAVFSAKLGGGVGMFCAESGRLKRVETISKDTKVSAVSIKDPILLDDTVYVRTNGVSVTGSTTVFTGDRQIMTLTHDPSTYSLRLKGIAHPLLIDNSTGNGGQEYAEILIFDKVPTDYEILQVESYLSKKWGLPMETTTPERELTITGTGTIQLDGDTILSSSSYYRGTLSANGCKLTMPTGKVPWTAAEVPADGRKIWVDPSLAGAVHFSDDPEKPDEVDYLNTRDNTGLLTGDGAYYLVSAYNTGNVSAGNCNRRVRYVDGWLNFEGGYDDEGWGNMMAMRKLPYQAYTNYADSVERLDGIKGGCMALNTSLDGGSFMLSAMNGTQDGLRLRSVDVAKTKIWNLNSTFTGTIATYLDGTEVDGLNKPFNKRKETLSFNVSDDSFKVKCYGYMDPSNSDSHNREIMGEWMLYSRNLSDEERQGIESYLMKKWQGKIRSGYCETREMSIGGSSAVTLNTIRQLPSLASDFSGTLTALDTTLAFTVESGASIAKDAISVGEKDLAFTNEVTVDVTVGSNVAGTITLITGALDDDSTFTLGEVTGTRKTNCTLRKTESGLYLDIVKPGFLIIVR